MYACVRISFQRSTLGTQIPKHQCKVAGAVFGLLQSRAVQDPHFIPVKVVFDGEGCVAEDLEALHLAGFEAVDEEDDEVCQCFTIALGGARCH